MDEVPDKWFEPKWNPKGIPEDVLEACWTEIVLSETVLDDFKPRPQTPLFDCALALYLREAVACTRSCLNLALAGDADGGAPIERKMWEIVMDVSYLITRTDGAETLGAQSVAWNIRNWGRIHELRVAAAEARTFELAPSGDSADQAFGRVCEYLEAGGLSVELFREAFETVGRFKYHWSGLNSAQRIKELRGIEERFERFGSGFLELTQFTWAVLSSEHHPSPNWELVRFGERFPESLCLGESSRDTAEFHRSFILSAGDSLASIRRAIHEARTGEAPRL